MLPRYRQRVETASPEQGHPASGADHRGIKTDADGTVGLNLIGSCLVEDAGEPQAGRPVPVVGCDVAEYADLAALRDRAARRQPPSKVPRRRAIADLLE